MPIVVAYVLLLGLWTQLLGQARGNGLALGSLKVVDTMGGPACLKT